MADRISVIIPVFNRPGMVERAVQSVLMQTRPADEIIAVDDGSSDDTADVLAGFGDRIHYVAHTRNRGVSAARNTGITRSTSPFIAFLDSDDWWYPGKLETQEKYFERHRDIRICQCEEIWIRKGRRVNPKKIHLKPSGDIFEPSLERCLVSPSAVMLKRSVLDETGFFDEDLPACEDYDLWLRISCRYHVPLIRKALVVKEGGHPDQLSARYPGMDRFRIIALVKLIRENPLQEYQLTAALKELKNKCRIYGLGCIKRGRTREGEYWLGLTDNLFEEGIEDKLKGLHPDVHGCGTIL